jgi:hypothetical protein
VASKKTEISLLCRSSMGGKWLEVLEEITPALIRALVLSSRARPSRMAELFSRTAFRNNTAIGLSEKPAPKNAEQYQRDKNQECR